MAFFKFCPKCGAKLSSKRVDGKSIPACSSKKCGFEFFQNSAPVAAGIVLNDKGQVLLVKRARAPHKGMWGFPGGFLNEGEHPKDGAVRELYEETRLRTKIIRHLGTYMERYAYKGRNAYSQNEYFVMKLVGGTLTLDSENTDAGWFDLNKLPKLAFENNYGALRDYLKQKNAKK